MKYKFEGAKFATLEDMKESLWPLYSDKMTREEFEKFIEANVEKSE